ncbi:exodeoxyribonuclease VII large subunit [Natranaerobius trueperi]|uniref:Exodeoxyribonuclease 7 large subunit n=1 Tax=Natranaerobius trueperi TaxID=759412 RepID=A0A226BYD5_9FIRM|nr:exodeoxyribonuclease VII large subunit [Natranaerobius trueperi]OWZ84016.1 exodeoxyribonuclease VII large subunit [Natranaerobius trueperi]
MEKQAVTVTQLTGYLKNLLLKDNNLKNVLVRGEISNFKHHSSGHMYFTIKDQGASLRCIMFRNRNWALDFKPRDGIKVIVSGFVGIYEKAGLYQLYVDSMQRDGMGSLHLAFEKLKNDLKEEGLFDTEYKKPIPKFPKKVVVITSPTGAAVRDMVVTISRRYPLTSITLIPVRVQGELAQTEIASGIQYANAMIDGDVILLGRGGGSLEEIWPFNTEDVARAIFNSQTPVVSCVGHETDFTISDFVSDLRAPTPTAAAELVVPDQEELMRLLEDYRQRLEKGLLNRVNNLRHKYHELVNRPVIKTPEIFVLERKKELEYLDQRLLREQYHLIQEQKNQFKILVKKLDSLSPLKVLKRGYTFCETEKGQVVTSIEHLGKGDNIQLQFSDGKADCCVKGTKNHSYDDIYEFVEGEGVDRGDK